MLSLVEVNNRSKNITGVKIHMTRLNSKMRAHNALVNGLGPGRVLD